MGRFPKSLMLILNRRGSNSSIPQGSAVQQPSILGVNLTQEGI
jgi:hypothetical protein